MNDFTKEELQHMYELAVEDKDFSINYNYQQFCERLLVKLQSMIDNYCEHDSIGQSDLPTAGTDE